jgi:predicted ester cyclase
MSVEDNKAVFRKYIQSLATPESLDEVVATDFVGHDLPAGFPGIEGLKKFRREVMEAFPDQISEILDIVAEGDRVAARIRIEGTHRRDFMGIAATGKRSGVDLYEFVRIANAKVVERWTISTRTVHEQGPSPTWW